MKNCILKKIKQKLFLLNRKDNMAFKSAKIKEKQYEQILKIKEEMNFRTIDEVVEHLLNSYYELMDNNTTKSKLNTILKYLEEDREINNLYLNYTDSLDEELRGKTHRIIEVGIEEREEKEQIRRHNNRLNKM